MFNKIISRQLLSSCSRNSSFKLIRNPTHKILRISPNSLKYFSTSSTRKAEDVSVTFVFTDGTKQTTKCKTGQNLLDIIVDNEIGIDGFGACEGTLACSTCHLIFKEEDYKRLPEEPIDEELDMLDLAYGLTDTSRLGCQVEMTKELDGLEVQVPEGINDQR